MPDIYRREKGKEAWLQGVVLYARGTADFLDAPTIEAGDVKVSTEGGNFVNITNLPQPVPAGSCSLEIYLTPEEMAADGAVKILLRDQTIPKQWEDRIVLVETRGYRDGMDDLMMEAREQILFGRLLKFTGVDPATATATYTGVLPEGHGGVELIAKKLRGNPDGSDQSITILRIDYSVGGNVCTPNPDGYLGGPIDADYVSMYVSDNNPLGTLTFQVSAAHTPISVTLTADHPRGYLGDDGRLVEWPNYTVGVVNIPRPTALSSEVAAIPEAVVAHGEFANLAAHAEDADTQSYLAANAISATHQDVLALAASVGALPAAVENSLLGPREWNKADSKEIVKRKDNSVAQTYVLELDEAGDVITKTPEA